MLKQLAILSLAACARSATVEVCFEDLHWKCKWTRLVIEGAVVTAGVVPADVTNLIVNKYEGSDQIERFEGLAKLQRIEMTGIRQNYTIRFASVPSLVNLFLDQNNLIYLGEDMFGGSNLEEVYLSGNKVSRIESRTFGRRVRKVFLQCNQLDVFKPGWFQNPAVLRELYLGGNEIRVVQQGAFEPFVDLDHVDLAFNRIHTMEPGSFGAKSGFDVINLSHNGLRKIDPEVFPAGRVVIGKSFDVRHNNLSFLSESLLRKLSAKNSLINGNPWQCPCYRNRILPWVDWGNYGTLAFPKDPPGQARCVSSLGTYALECIDAVAEEPIEYFRRNTPPPRENRRKYCLRYK